jgi:hypothetical protein
VQRVDEEGLGSAAPIFDSIVRAGKQGSETACRSQFLSRIPAMALSSSGLSWSDPGYRADVLHGIIEGEVEVRSRIVVRDKDPADDPGAQHCARARVAERDPALASSLHQTIIEDWHPDDLVGFAGGKGDRAARGHVILSSDGRVIAGRIIDRDNPIEVIDAPDGGCGWACALGYQIRGGYELDGALTQQGEAKQEPDEPGDGHRPAPGPGLEVSYR